MKLSSFKNDYQVSVRPKNAKCHHVDNLFIRAFTSDDAVNRIKKLLKNGAHVPALGKRIDYVVAGVTNPGEDLYGLDEVECCDCDRPTAYIGSSYIV